MQGVHGDQLRGHLATIVLSVLEQGEAHGLEILNRLEEAGCGLLKLKEGSLYPALYRLEASRLVKTRQEKAGHGRRGARRRYYRITNKGLRSLARQRVEWRRFVTVIGGIVGAPA